MRGRDVPDPDTELLLAEWDGDWGGVPPFDRVSVAAFEPAIEAAMAANLDEIERIAANPEPPTFENTLAAMERAGRPLDRVLAVFGVWCSNMSTPAVQEAERTLAPRLAAFSDRITQNEALFRRIEAVQESPAKSSLGAEQQRLAWLYHTNFVRAGARLNAADKSTLSGINQRLAALFTQFSQNILADEAGYHLVLEKQEDLAGLPQSLRDGAAALAASKGLDGKWVISNTRSFMEPFLTWSDRRDLRERGWRMWVNRGDNGDEHDNKAIITEILALRAARAKLLGYDTHAHWRLETSMARTPDRALQLMRDVWTPAVARVREEVADMQAIADAEGSGVRIEPWDYRYYAEKVRKARYDLDQNEVKPYLQLEHLRAAMFHVADRLLGFTFKPVENVPVYHPDVRVWRVVHRDGRHAGLWYFDPYARDGKRSGAWMSAFRSQEKFDGAVTTIVSNNSNFVKPRPGEAALLSWDDAVTLFHEFGHALHGLSSDVAYPSLSGTAVPRDYVEFPSQLLEHWLTTTEVLRRFALHYQSGAPIPDDLVRRIDNASKFNQGFGTTEYLASAIIDLELHLAGDVTIDPAAFERDALQRLGTPREIVMRHRTPSFQHVFGSDGYSAGYYSYLWADVLVADAWNAFLEASGPYDAGVAASLVTHVFSRGNTIDPADGYRAFRGRDPDITALLEKRGFA
ncbi:MAG TPA: M3 family metallopeptidase [Longimicrobiales bacterium]